MSRIRSPGYPSTSLPQAIQLVEKIYASNRANAIDREAAVRDMGYSGVTGQSAKMLADLSHYALVEKAGKGGVRVSQIAVRIIAFESDSARQDALLHSAYSPELFADIKKQWPDGFVSEHALRNWLLRRGFATSAIPTVMQAYTETYDFLKKQIASESHGQSAPAGQESDPLGGDDAAKKERHESYVPPPPSPPPPRPTKSGVEMMAGERVVFIEESAAAQYLKLVASGEIDGDMLEALEDFVRRQKKRLARGQPLQSAPEAE